MQRMAARVTPIKKISGEAVLECVKLKGRSWILDEVRILDRREQEGTITGSLLGILTFLGGIALLALTFKLAIDMFHQDPQQIFVQPGKTLDISQAAGTL